MPFLAFPDSIREVVYTTNSIESLNARYRRAATACGHFPNEQAALKRIYLATLALDPSGRGRKRWNNKWEGSTERVRPALRRPPYRRTGIGQSDQQNATRPKGLKTPKS